MQVRFPGFPDAIAASEIAFPDPMDILHEPILGFAPADWVRRFGSAFQRELLDAAPLTNRTRYVLMSTQVRVVTPRYLIHPVELPDLGNTRNEWHVDYFPPLRAPRADAQADSSAGTAEPAPKDGPRGDACVHAIANALGTEFNVTPVTIDIPEGTTLSYRWFCKETTLHGAAWGLSGKMAPDRRFVSFDRHIHRAPLATHRTLRYFVRIAEVNIMMNATGVYQAKASMVFDGNKPVRNVVQHDDGNITIEHA